MPLEVRELVIKVHVGEPNATSRTLDEQELATLKRELVEACLVELRQRARATDER